MDTPHQTAHTSHSRTAMSAACCTTGLRPQVIDSMCVNLTLRRAVSGLLNEVPGVAAATASGYFNSNYEQTRDVKILQTARAAQLRSFPCSWARGAQHASLRADRHHETGSQYQASQAITLIESSSQKQLTGLSATLLLLRTASSSDSTGAVARLSLQDRRKCRV